ncbi:MAG TPA: NUDIX domain-containing protein [Gemmatimonadales bacterium]|nr:NUDIX domain-containing protein [Gemmatimonadales bacterium]
MTASRVAYVDTYVLRQLRGLQILALRRAAGGRCPGSWETVHGTIEAGETPVDASLRELREETGFAAQRLYNVSRVETFYQHRTDEIALVPVFAAFVVASEEPRISREHDRAEWLAPADAAARFSWPRERRTVADLVVLFGGAQGEAGEAAGAGGSLEDVLRIC